MRVRSIAVVAAFALLVVPHSYPDVPVVAQVEKIEVSGIDNFSQIEQSSGFAGTRIGFGGATQAEAMPALKKQGFATVINLRLASEESVDLENSIDSARAAGLNYIHLPFDTAAPASEVVEKFLAAVGNEANQPVYVHCGSATRAAALWMISRVLADGWEISAASAEAGQIARKPTVAIGFATTYLESLGE